MVELLIAFFGALTGGLIAIIGSFALDSHQRDKARNSLRAAISVEIASICELVQRREYAMHLRGFAQKVLGAQPGESRIFRLPVTQSYFTVYESNAGALGGLGTGEVVSIVSFYQQARSILDSVLDQNEPGPEISNADISAFYENVAVELENLCNFGDGLVDQLASLPVRDKIADSAAKLTAARSSALEGPLA